MADEEKRTRRWKRPRLLLLLHARVGSCEIRSGDTFYALARRFGVSLEAILAANPGVDPETSR